MDRLANEGCFECIFFDPLPSKAEEADHGFCHRYAPRPRPQSEAPDEEDGRLERYWVQYPFVHTEHWCGEFERNRLEHPTPDQIRARYLEEDPVAQQAIARTVESVARGNYRATSRTHASVPVEIVPLLTECVTLCDVCDAEAGPVGVWSTDALIDAMKLVRGIAAAVDREKLNHSPGTPEALT